MHYNGIVRMPLLPQAERIVAILFSEHFLRFSAITGVLSLALGFVSAPVWAQPAKHFLQVLFDTNWSYMSQSDQFGIIQSL